ncbi:hypothetical protein [Acrocarpospora macrocephala]|uniref:hypothetical protein n=1 Tax=Acrocarpospora macrocephala TaxID=150177 RepID=UPI0012D3496A|nr:hypothetical protein [Acrocarpospora macrocephala]
MPLAQIPLDDLRVLALAKARQQLAHDGTGYVPAWEELTDTEREQSLGPARSYLYRFRAAPTGGMSVGTVLSKLAETAAHVGEFAREFGTQNWVDMDEDEDEAADWRKVVADLEAAATTFRRTVNLIG